MSDTRDTELVFKAVVDVFLGLNPEFCKPKMHALLDAEVRRVASSAKLPVNTGGFGMLVQAAANIKARMPAKADDQPQGNAA